MGLMIDAYKTAADSLKERAAVDQRAFKRLPAKQAVVVQGCYDHTERVLDALELSFTAVSPEHLASLELPVDHPVFVNCPGNIPSDGIQWLRRRVEVEGGCVVTTDWALRNCIEPAFPGFIEYNGRSTTDDVVSVTVAPQGMAMLGDLISPNDDPRWWLEGSSHPIRLLDADRVDVLIDSEEMKAKYGDGSIVVRFKPGKGTVYHMVSHAYLQRTKAKTTRQEASASEFLIKKGITGKAASLLKGDQTVGEVEAAYLSIGLVARILSGEPEQRDHPPTGLKVNVG